MSAMLQLEFQRGRHNEMIRSSCGDARGMARTVLDDVLKNGGTMVLVVTDDRMTLVQREEAEDLEEPVSDRETDREAS